MNKNGFLNLAHSLNHNIFRTFEEEVNTKKRDTNKFENIVKKKQI